MDALVLLEQWQGEHERNELGLHQYAKQKDLLLRALQERTAATQDLQEETTAIKKKTVLHAGTTALQLHLIDQEGQEGRVLDDEISRLTEEMRLKETELEQRFVKTSGRCGQATLLLERPGWPTQFWRHSKEKYPESHSWSKMTSEQPLFSTLGATANAGGDRGRVMGHGPAPATCGAPKALQG